MVWGRQFLACAEIRTTILRSAAHTLITISTELTLFQELTDKIIIYVHMFTKPVPVAARSKAWVCGRPPAEIVGSNPTGGMDVCLL